MTMPTQTPEPPSLHTLVVDAERPPICPTCGVTMVPASLSARPEQSGDWICLECEETGESHLE
jgi:hypothetical protein